MTVPFQIARMSRAYAADEGARGRAAGRPRSTGGPHGVSGSVPGVTQLLIHAGEADPASPALRTGGLPLAPAGFLWQC